MTETTSIRSDASTGNIDIVFSDLSVVGGSFSDESGSTDATITDNGKHIEINIDEACPRYTANIFYEVTNNGTAPITYELAQSVKGGPFSMNVCQDTSYIYIIIISL